MKDWKKWLKEQREKSTMIVRQIPLARVSAAIGSRWGMKEDGNYRQEPPAFFNIIGAEIQANREVSAWSQPILKELGKGVVVLVEAKHIGFLLVARQEPGNPADKNYILLGPTIQASESNLLQKHGGKKPPFAELLDKYGEPEWVELSQDAGRFLGKVNKYGTMCIDNFDEVTLPPNARWFKPDEIAEALLKGEVNEHLTQALAVLFCQTGIE